MAIRVETKTYTETRVYFDTKEDVRDYMKQKGLGFISTTPVGNSNTCLTMHWLRLMGETDEEWWARRTAGSAAR